MNVTKEKNNTTLKLSIEGRIDTTTAPVLEEEIKQSVSDVSELVMDFEKVEYISSAGLRVLLSTQKVMNKQGAMNLINVSEEVKEVFDITGFSDILTIN